MSLSIFRPGQERAGTQPPIDLDSEINQRIIESIEATDIDLERCMLVGSAALALYGVRLGLGPNGSPRPSDVDLAASPVMMHELMDQGQTPSGMGITKKGFNSSRTVLRIASDEHDPRLLPVDLLARVTSDDERRTVLKFDRKFIAKTLPRSSTVVPGTNIRIATPRHIAEDLYQTAGLDPKAQGDLNAIRRHFPDQRIP